MVFIEMSAWEWVDDVAMQGNAQPKLPVLVGVAGVVGAK